MTAPCRRIARRNSATVRPRARLFVYGSLMRGEGRHALLATLPGARLVARGWVRGRMLDLTGYPGAVRARAGEDRIVGQLWEIDPRPGMLRTVDRYEACHPGEPGRSLFTRRRAAVHLRRRTVRAWVYFLVRPPRAAEVVRGGDWRTRGRARPMARGGR
jgi:gamma-glutamylcyclotransferase (GGCT)/AIG2-like uncharacterized protein YtfP